MVSARPLFDRPEFRRTLKCRDPRIDFKCYQLGAARGKRFLPTPTRPRKSHFDGSLVYVGAREYTWSVWRWELQQRRDGEPYGSSGGYHDPWTGQYYDSSTTPTCMSSDNSHCAFQGEQRGRVYVWTSDGWTRRGKLVSACNSGVQFPFPMTGHGWRSDPRPHPSRTAPKEPSVFSSGKRWFELAEADGRAYVLLQQDRRSRRAVNVSRVMKPSRDQCAWIRWT